jgi:hypothetical protein
MPLETVAVFLGDSVNGANIVLLNTIKTDHLRPVNPLG